MAVYNKITTPDGRKHWPLADDSAQLTVSDIAGIKTASRWSSENPEQLQAQRRPLLKPAQLDNNPVYKVAAFSAAHL